MGIGVCGMGEWEYGNGVWVNGSMGVEVCDMGEWGM